jgi:hypothetical protein
MNIKNLIQEVKNTASVVALVVFRFPSVFILKHDYAKQIISVFLIRRNY